VFAVGVGEVGDEGDGVDVAVFVLVDDGFRAVVFEGGDVGFEDAPLRFASISSCFAVASSLGVCHDDITQATGRVNYSH